MVELQPPRASGFTVKGCGESRAVDTKSLYLGGEALFVAVGLLSAFDRGIERVECERQTLDRGVDCALLGHCL